jgi:MscS family membrane protein
VLDEIRRLLRDDPRVDPGPARVRFLGFGTCSLNCELFAYVLAADHGEFLAIREGLLLKIMEIVAACGTSLAFPSQTLYVGRDTLLNGTRGDGAGRRRS